jgi:hypothetical protein
MRTLAWLAAALVGVPLFLWGGMLLLGDHAGEVVDARPICECRRTRTTLSIVVRRAASTTATFIAPNSPTSSQGEAPMIGGQGQPYRQFTDKRNAVDASEMRRLHSQQTPCGALPLPAGVQPPLPRNLARDGAIFSPKPAVFVRRKGRARDERRGSVCREWPRRRRKAPSDPPAWGGEMWNPEPGSTAAGLVASAL